MNIFLDCGGWIGSSIDRFKQMPEYRGEWKLYSFEPNPRFFKHYEKHPDVTLIKSACWDHDGMLDFVLNRKRAGQAGRVKGIKKEIADVAVTKVTCIDMAKWITDNTAADDRITMKMDIEGSEYTVLPHLLANNIFPRITRIYIEWHECRQDKWRRLGNGNEARADLILAGIARQNPKTTVLGNLEDALEQLHGR